MGRKEKTRGGFVPLCSNRIECGHIMYHSDKRNTCAFLTFLLFSLRVCVEKVLE